MTEFTELDSLASATEADAPSDERAALRRVLADTVAVIASGLRAEPTRRFRSSLGTGDQESELAAALGYAAVSEEWDECLLDGGHPGAHVVPVALALACSRPAISGQALLDAVLSGYRIAARLFDLHRPQYPAHPHGNLANVGAAVAAARLIHTDPIVAARIASDLMLASTWQPSVRGTGSRPATAGYGALLGLHAARMAQAGLDGSENGLREWARFAATRPPAQLARSASASESVSTAPEGLLASRIRLIALPAPCQSAAEAARAMAERANSCQKISITIPPRLEKVTRVVPENENAARFSIPYVVAHYLLGGDTPTPRLGFRKQVANLASAITVSVCDDPELGAIGVRLAVEGAEPVVVRDPAFTAPADDGVLAVKLGHALGDRGSQLASTVQGLSGEPEAAAAIAGYLTEAETS